MLFRAVSRSFASIVQDPNPPHDRTPPVRLSEESCSVQKLKNIPPAFGQAAQQTVRIIDEKNCTAE